MRLEHREVRVRAARAAVEDPRLDGGGEAPHVAPQEAARARQRREDKAHHEHEKAYIMCVQVDPPHLRRPSRSTTPALTAGPALRAATKKKATKKKAAPKKKGARPPPGCLAAHAPARYRLFFGGSCQLNLFPACAATKKKADAEGDTE